MTADPVLRLHRWLSPAYPVGGFAYSHGLEAAIAEARFADAKGAGTWIDGILRHGTGRNDALFLAAAWHAAPEDIADIADLCRAMASSAGRRLEMDKQGAAFAATTAAVEGLDVPALPYPVAIGRAARLADLPLDPAIRLYLMAFAGNLVSAAIRLVPLGQTDGQRILAACEPLCADLAAAAAPGDLDGLGSAAFLADIAAMRQETLAVRLFRS